MEVEKLIRNLIEEQKLTLAELLLGSPVGEDDPDRSPGCPDACPHCSHRETVRNGSIRGKPRFKCKGCKPDVLPRRFQTPIPERQGAILLEEVSGADV